MYTWVLHGMGRRKKRSLCSICMMCIIQEKDLNSCIIGGVLFDIWFVIQCSKRIVDTISICRCQYMRFDIFVPLLLF